MRIVRWQPDASRPPEWGWVDGDRLGRLEGSPFGEYRRQAAKVPLERGNLARTAAAGQDHLCRAQLSAARRRA